MISFKKLIRPFSFFALFFAISLVALIGYYYVPYTVGIENTGDYGINKLNIPSSFIINVSESDKNDPNAFGNLYVDFPVSKYFISSYEEVLISSRRDNLTISGWLMMQDKSRPLIIVIHGVGDSKAEARFLIQAGMLYKNGFNVLMIDLINHGKSDNTGFHTVGILESYDVLDAIQWLTDTQGIDIKNIGLLGNSFGAITAAIAFTRDSEIPGVFLDSPASSFKQVVQDEINYQKWPQFIKHLTVLTNLYGFSANEIEPLDAIKNANGRPIFLTHCKLDKRVLFHHAEIMVNEAKKLNADLTFWPVDNLRHNEQIYAHPKLYEQKMVTFFNRVFNKTP